ncbi:hypothetical protein NLX78_07635 [Paenibacillus sp. Lou8.1]|uniref:hypothetical protein n=1 Tax=Paenibacillus sp. Lou8.1 TaxID=2962041 RepID=UPI0020B770E4|nr:hypothetical protein [Paenibacillus sp. Lou8.1]MCP3807102.1 hypothetical protein [Paenibacillus sp. Lou8.1]
MSGNFSAMSSYIKTCLTYSEIFQKKASEMEIKSDIRCINLDEALSILSQFSVLDDVSRKELKSILKRFVGEQEFIENMEPFDVNNLMYAMKWFIAYGTRNPQYSFQNDFNVSFNVFMTVLKISDYMVDKIDDYEDVEDAVLKSSLFVRNTQMDRALLHQHMMFEEIARSAERFKPQDYINIHEVFENKYGYTISEYISVIFSLSASSIKGRKFEEIIQKVDWGIDPELFFENISIKETALAIYNDLCIDPLNLKEWARATIDNPYDFEPLLITPIFKSQSVSFPSSPGNMNSVIFDGLFFKIRNCFGAKDESFFRFYGRIFEIYISDLLKDAVKEAKIKSYKFIDEFSYGKKQGELSSDAYILLGKSLLVIECKSGRIRTQTKLEADKKTTLEDFQKYVMKPIQQANKTYSEILKQDPQKFNGANKVFIFSVSNHSFPRLPKYHRRLEDKKWLEDLHPNVKYIDYLGINDIEVIAYTLKKLDKTIFSFIKTKKNNTDYIPYPNYFHTKYGEIKRLESHDEKLKEVFQKIKETLKFKK